MKFDFHYGRIGSGKTLLSVFKALKDFYEGRTIIGNLHLAIPNSVYVEPADILESLDPRDTSKFGGSIGYLLNSPEPKTLILDEIGKWWDSRNSSSLLNRFLAYFVDQCRKRNINIIVTDQHISGLDIRGRQTTDTLTRCICQYYPNYIRDDRGRPVPYKFHFVALKTEWEGIKPPKRFSWLAEDVKGIYKLFRTEEIIIPAEIMLRSR